MRSTVRIWMLGFWIVFIMLLSLASKAQTSAKYESTSEYKNAVGLRGGETSGLTFKHFTPSGNAFEFILGMRWNGAGATALYERHISTGAEGLKFYYGAGGHVAHQFRRNYYYDNARARYVYNYYGQAFGLGIDGIVGIDYKIPVLPLALSADLKPFAEINNLGDMYFAADPSLGIKITF